MSQQIAEFYAKITADTQGLQQSLDAANKKLDALAGQSEKTGGSVGGLTGKIASMINPTTLAIGGITALAKYLGSATAAAAESAQVDAKLEAVLRATGYAAGLTSKDIGDMSSSMSNLTGIDDEVIKGGAAVLATFREIGGDVFPEAMQAALDMSAVMGQDLQSSIVQVGKALNDPIAGVSALRKVGVQLTDQQQEQIKTFIASGDVMKAQQVILGELSMEFGGAAEAMNAAGTGANNLKVALGNLQEELGGGMVAGVRQNNNALTDMVNWLTESVHSQNEFEGALSAANPKLYEQYLVLRAVTPEMKAAVEAYQEQAAVVSVSADRYDDMSDAVARSTEAVGLSEEQVKEISEANSSFLGVLGDVDAAMDDYYGGLREAKQALDEGKLSVDEHKAKVAELSAQYEEAKNQIVLSIVEMKLAADGWTNAELDAYLRIGQELGAFSEDTVNASKAAIESADQMVSGINEAVDPIVHVGERALDAGEDLGIMADNAVGLGDDINSSATPAVAGLKSVINQLSDKSVNVDVYIRRHGSLANLPDTASPTAELDQFDYHNWTGGPLGNGWTVVGDMPGGAWGPYTELVSPSGYVLDAKTSRKMREAGMLGAGVDYAYFGTEDVGGTYSSPKSTYYTPKPKRGRNRRTIARAAEAAGSDAGSMVITTQEEPGEALSGIGDQVAGDVASSALSAMQAAQQAATSASIASQSVLREINGSLQSLLGKTPSASDIGRAVGVENSKFS